MQPSIPNHQSIEILLNSKHANEINTPFLLEKLVEDINQLILNDFEKLIQLLYRIDVSETKLKEVLQKNPNTDAGIIIAKLIVERQLQKIKTAASFSQNSDSESADEKW